MSKTILITGANRGIGLALATQAVKRNDIVIATSRKLGGSELEKLKKEYPANITLIPLDVTSAKSVQELPSHLKPQRQIDILINNAGIYSDQDLDFEKTSDEVILNSFQTNTMGAYRVTRAVLPWLKKSEEPIIANITSLMGSIADNKMGTYYGYRMSKAALNMFTKNLSVDFPKITSVVLHPGWVQTSMGGSQAPVKPDDSARGLWQVILNLKLNQSGQFFDYKGKVLPW